MLILSLSLSCLFACNGDGGYPYQGFYNVTKANNVLIEKCVMTGHKVYLEDRNGVKDSGTPMGNYDINSNCANAITWKDCTQSNSTTDRSLWGVMGSNYSKNLTFDGCNLSRFDAHEGMVNTTIKNSTIGQYINCIGSGSLTLINVTKLVGPEFLSFRKDYGSTWEGDILIKDCTMVGYTRAPGSYDPMAMYSECDKNSLAGQVHLMTGDWTEWDFGYTCYLPQNVTIDNFTAEHATVVYAFNWNALTAGSLTNVTNPLQFTKTITLLNKPDNYSFNLCSTSNIFDQRRQQGLLTVTGM